MKELVVISGKGGTGKTSLVASFAALAENAVLADCDVDAADLHLILEPKTRHSATFFGGKEAQILVEECVACSRCEAVCRFDAVRFDGPPSRTIDKTYRVEPIACEGCGVCAHFCPTDAIVLQPVVTGEWYVSDTRRGPMVHARLRPAGENSGKLVTLVRNRARELAEELGRGIIIVDGAPGIGCPVVASITGADLVLIVTEPTLSGLHDFERVHALVRHFGVPALLCINKADINPAIGEQIAGAAQRLGVSVVGTIPYDTVFTKAQLDGLSVVEYAQSPTADRIRRLWQDVEGKLANGARPEGKL